MEQALSPTLDLTEPLQRMGKALTRWKASAIHLSICAIIGYSVLAWMLLVWYPAPYFEVVWAPGSFP